MNEEINVDEVVENEVELYDEEEFEEMDSRSGTLAGVAIGVVASVLGTVLYKKAKPVFGKIKDKFKKNDESEEVEAADETNVEVKDEK